MAQRFIAFVMMQAQQASLFLGEIPHPQTGKTEVNLDAARFFIDQLEMIQEKTRGNLSGEEGKILGGVLSDLRMAYVRVAKAEAGEPQAGTPAEEPAKEQAVTEVAGTEGEPTDEAGDSPRKRFSKSYGS